MRSTCHFGLHKQEQLIRLKVIRNQRCINYLTKHTPVLRLLLRSVFTAHEPVCHITHVAALDSSSEPPILEREAVYCQLWTTRSEGVARGVLPAEPAASNAMSNHHNVGAALLPMLLVRVMSSSVSLFPSDLRTVRAGNVRWHRAHQLSAPCAVQICSDRTLPY